MKASEIYFKGLLRPFVSIIICTRNRAASLRVTLASIEQTQIPKGWRVEILVVDNGSDDHTKSVAETAVKNSNSLPLRYLSEPLAGKGHAYNAGLAAAQGDVLLFTDDDVRVPNDWLKGMCTPIIEGKAEAVQGGIRIAPHLERPWLTGILRVWLAAVEDPVRAPEGLVGANMAVARRAAEHAGGFDPRLGPGASGFFDDTLFGWTLQKAGQRIAYHPEVYVEHHFAPDRLTFDYYLRTARQMARSRAQVMKILEPVLAPPSTLEFCQHLAGLVCHLPEQLWKLHVRREPVGAFILHYYYLYLWSATRRSRK